MRLLKSLVFLAALAAAEKVPVLSEPMVVTAQGATLDVGGDSVYLAGKGRISLYKREASEILTISTASQSRIVSDLPHMFVCITSHCVVGEDTVYANYREYGTSVGDTWRYWLHDTLEPILGGSLGASNGYANAGQFYGGSFVAGTGTVDHFLVAGATKVQEFVYAFRSEDSATILKNGYRLKDSLVTTWGHPLLSFSGPHPYSNTFGAMALPVRQGKYSILADSAKYLLRATLVDTLQADSLNWIVSDQAGFWLAYDQVRSMFYNKGRRDDDVIRIDSIHVPELKPGNRRNYQVTRVDSLIVFNTDSSVVLARWTPEEFRIQSIVPLGKPVLATTFRSKGWVYDPVGKQNMRSNDGILWATTGSELYSFKLGWQDAASSSISNPGYFENGLTIRSSPGSRTASFVWKGRETLSLDLVGLDGRKIASLDVRPGQSVKWRAPRQGLYLVRTAQGTSKLLVR